MKKICTLCIVHQHPRILLGMKKIGFGAGMWNGLGGKVEEGESVEGAAIREMKEEASIEPRRIEKFGILEFEFESDSKILEVHIFKVDDFDGDPTESEEMNPKWFHVDAIPYHQMWSDDIHWLPKFLEGKKFKGKFLFDKPSSSEYSAKILKHDLVEVEEL